MMRDEQTRKKQADNVGQFEVLFLAVESAQVQISAAIGNLRHRFAAEAAIYKATLRRNQELEVELDRLREQIAEFEAERGAEETRRLEERER